MVKLNYSRLVAVYKTAGCGPVIRIYNAINALKFWLNPLSKYKYQRQNEDFPLIESVPQ